MGASSRPARRRLKPAALLRPIAGPPHPLVVPLRAAAYAAVLGLLVLAVDQVAVTDTQEPWLQLAGAAIVAGCLLTAGLFAWTAWQRHRDGLAQRVLLSRPRAPGAAAPAALAPSFRA